MASGYAIFMFLFLSNRIYIYLLIRMRRRTCPLYNKDLHSLTSSGVLANKKYVKVSYITYMKCV